MDSFDVTGFSGFAITALATALPLKLTVFSGRLQHNKILLQWTSAGEYNTDHFELCRSFDGSRYEPIGKVMAAGTSNAHGQAIRQHMIANNTETFSIAELPPGLYLLKLQNGETIRLVKQ